MSKRKVKSKKAASKKKSVNTRQKKQRPTGRLPGVFVVIIGVIAAGYFIVPYTQPVPEVSRPINEAALDPAVVALITPMFEAIEENPRDAVLHANLGMAYEANTLWKEAQKSYGNAVALSDDEMAWHLHYAIATREAGDVEGALELLEETARVFPTSGAVYHRLAEARAESGQLDAAEDAYRAVISYSPRLAQGYVGLGDILLQKGQVDEAIRYAKRGIELQSDYRLGHYVLGQAYLQAGQSGKAEKSLARGGQASVHYVPDPLTNKIDGYIVNATGRLALAQALLDGGQPADAAGVLEETYQYHPANIMLLNTLAVSYMRTRRLDQAEQLLKRALSIDERNFYTYLNLYNWALRSNKKELALVYADSSVARAPERDDTHLARAQALVELNRLEDASLSAQTARELGAQNAANFGLSGEIALQLEQYDDAYKHFINATKLDSAHILSRVGLARTALATGKIEEARYSLAMAKALGPGHPAVLQLERELATRE